METHWIPHASKPCMWLLLTTTLHDMRNTRNNDFKRGLNWTGTFGVDWILWITHRQHNSYGCGACHFACCADSHRVAALMTTGVAGMFRLADVGRMSSTLVETVSLNYDDFNDSFLTCGTCLCVYDGQVSARPFTHNFHNHHLPPANHLSIRRACSLQCLAMNSSLSQMDSLLKRTPPLCKSPFWWW